MPVSKNFFLKKFKNLIPLPFSREISIFLRSHGHIPVLHPQKIRWEFTRGCYKKIESSCGLEPHMRRLVPPACHPLSYVYSHVATIFLLSVSSSSFFLQVCVCYAVYHGTYGTDRSGCHHPMQVPDVLSVPGYDVLLLLFLPSYPLVLIVYLPLLLSLFGLCSPGIHCDPLSGYLFFFSSTP